MSVQKSGEDTLPSLQALATTNSSQTRYFLTIAFHPDASRIGERAELDLDSGYEDVIGRNVPCFDSGIPLEDPYISRRALVLKLEGDTVRVTRPSAANRCRIGTSELVGDLLLAPSTLHSGVAILLSHCVVLLLYRSESGPCAAEIEPYGLVGRSEPMQALRRAIHRVASSDRDVLLRGETGTGKELVANAIHRMSERSAHPFVAVNMSAIPAALAAASLFGSARGAFTGATKTQDGYFQQADSGTLFLDEVGDTAEEVQPILLRALQEREIQTVGGPVKPVDLRVVSATDAVLDNPDGNFNAALRHRLGALEILLPALRERRADIGELTVHFLRVIAQREGLPDPLPNKSSEPKQIAAWALIFHAFLDFHWPGNVRQLANYAAQVVLERDGIPQLPAGMREAIATPCTQTEAPVPEVPAAPLHRQRLSDIGDPVFREAMEHCRYEVSAVAEALGVSRQSVYRRVHHSGEFRLASEVKETELAAALAQHGGDVEAVALALAVSESALRTRLKNAG